MADISISYLKGDASKAQDIEDPDKTAAITDSVIQEEVKQGWTSYFWDTLEKSPQERAFLFKLDGAILTIACLGYFCKYLDQSNINNAFVSGMKEDLGLYGNQLNIMTTCWTVGYVIGEIPSNMILTRIRPSIWIPTLEVIWTVLTFCLSRCNTAGQIYALRFFIGLAESGFFPGMSYMIGSWYRSDELGRRSGIFQAAAGLGVLISGNLAAAVYRLDGKGGFAGWQWLFIVDGIISLPIAVAGYFMIPDMPQNSRAWYLKKEEVVYAQRRMELEGRQYRQPYTKAKFRKIFTSWHIYGLTLLYVLFNNASVSGTPVFAQFLKNSTDPKYTVEQINNYPTTTAAVQVFTTFLFAWVSDTVCKGARWPPILFSGALNLMYFISLAVWDIPVSYKWFLYVMIGTFPGIAGLLMSWAHEICTEDTEERALVIASMNEMGYAIQAWLPLLIWKQTDAPMYRTGFIAATCISMAFLANTLVVVWLQRREQRSRAAIRDRDRGN